MAPLNRNRFVDILTSVILIVFFDAAHASFCDTFLAQFPSRCPKVSTVESLDLNKFTGAWFEVGSSALRKFSVGSGLSCNSAHFSTLGAATDGNNVAGFINRGLRTVSPFRADQVWRISAATGRISRNLRRVCEAAVYSARAHAAIQTMLVPEVQGAGGNDGNGSGVDSNEDMSSNSSTGSSSPFSQHPNGTAIATEAAGVLAASGGTLSRQAEAIYWQLGALQQHNDLASTFNNPQEPGIDAIKQGLRDAANRIIGAAGRARRAGMAGSLAVMRMQLMLPADNSSAATRFTSRLSGSLTRASMELGLRGKAGLATTMIRVLAASVLVPSLTMFPSPIPWNSQTQLRMRAVQDRKQPGKFAVSLFGFARSNNYLINKLEGDPFTDYNMTTIVSCDSGQFSVTLLSRTPTVSQSDIDSQLSELQTQGIVLGGANIFIKTNQEELACTNMWGN